MMSVTRPRGVHDRQIGGPRRPDAFGQYYPASWPAGPWVVPLFWLIVLFFTYLWHWLN